MIPRELWTAAAQRVFDDVVATTPLRWAWEVAVHEDEEVPPDPVRGAPTTGRSSAYASTLTITFDPQPEPRRRPLARAELWLHVRGSALRRLPERETDLEQAALHLLREDLQDRVTDELWTGWPACPGHTHPRQPALRDGRAVWLCPRSDGEAVPVGRLHGQAPLSGTQ